MGKTLFWYVVREIVVPFMLGLFIFTFVLLMFQILKLTELVVSYGVAVLDVLKILSYILPPFFVFTVPMSFLLGVMLAVSRLSSDSELTAIKASGIGLYQLLPPVMLLAVIAYFVSAFLTLYAEPWGKQSFKQTLLDLGKKKAMIGITERIFNDQFKDMVMYVSRMDPVTSELKDVFIADERMKNSPSITVAANGKIISSSDETALVLSLNDGAIHRSPLDNALHYETIRFGKYDIRIDLTPKEDEDEGGKTYLEMTLPELKKFIRQIKNKGDQYMFRRAWTEYHRKFSFPFACFVFGILGLPLGINPPRSGRSRGFTMAIIIISIYYLLFRMSENMSWNSVLHPILFIWMPNAVLLLSGLILLQKKANETPIKSLDFISYQWEKVLMALEPKLKVKLLHRPEDEKEEE